MGRVGRWGGGGGGGAHVDARGGGGGGGARARGTWFRGGEREGDKCNQRRLRPHPLPRPKIKREKRDQQRAAFWEGRGGGGKRSQEQVPICSPFFNRSVSDAQALDTRPISLLRMARVRASSAFSVVTQRPKDDARHLSYFSLFPLFCKLIWRPMLSDRGRSSDIGRPSPSSRSLRAEGREGG
jgi:hypothetical protein